VENKLHFIPRSHDSHPASTGPQHSPQQKKKNDSGAIQWGWASHVMLRKPSSSQLGGAIFMPMLRASTHHKLFFE
jgi:hypothetical protein